MKLIAEINEIEKSLRHTLVRRKEQLKGIIWYLELGLKDGTDKEILKEIKKRYLQPSQRLLRKKL